MMWITARMVHTTRLPGHHRPTQARPPSTLSHPLISHVYDDSHQGESRHTFKPLTRGSPVVWQASFVSRPSAPTTTGRAPSVYAVTSSTTVSWPSPLSPTWPLPLHASMESNGVHTGIKTQAAMAGAPQPALVPYMHWNDVPLLAVR